MAPALIDSLSILRPLVALLPAGLLFFLSYGRYDGAFRDQTVFLHFMGGLLLGGFLGFVILVLYSTNAALVQVLLPALLFPISITSIANRRKWQAEPHAVFNGGAIGLGAAVTVSLSFVYVIVTVLDWAAVGQALALATALAGLLLGIGLLSGDAVRRKKPFRGALMGSAILLAPAVFLEEFFQSSAWLWLVLLVVYGLVFGIAAQKRLLPQGLSDESRRERRRQLRSAP